MAGPADKEVTSTTIRPASEMAEGVVTGSRKSTTFSPLT